ncbi:hypothetical protein K9M42_02360 [Patescibacteria group bacterium]|nr:hypothetical protein [Patescibacteria group bacterium]
MLIQFECPLCGEFNEVCMCGKFEIKNFKCHGCKSGLDIFLSPNTDFPDVCESQNSSYDEGYVTSALS